MLKKITYAFSFPVVGLASAVTIDIVALVWLLTHPGLPSGIWGAAAIHLAAALPLLLQRGLPKSQRSLALSLSLALPFIGAVVAALALGTRGRSEITQAIPEDSEIGASIGTEDVHRLTEALSCCEALLSADVDQRRAILAALNQRADANSVRILRWALGASDTDLAVEAALTLEDLNTDFEARLAACREELTVRPSFAAALAIADTVAEAIEAGIVDEPLVPSLALEARAAYERAGCLDPARFDVATVGRAQMELLLLRPDTALECIDHALPTASPDMLRHLLLLREQAILASHSLPWEGPSALKTYRPPPLPPPFAARRMPSSASLSPGVSGGTGARAIAERARTGSRRYPLYPILGAGVSRGDN